jgi:hypothetical protein
MKGRRITRRSLLVLVAVVGLMLLPTTAIGRSDHPVVGSWERLDPAPDLSRVYWFVDRSVDGVYPITLYDEGASACVDVADDGDFNESRGWMPGDPRYSAIFQGIGVLGPVENGRQVLTVSSSAVWCAGSPEWATLLDVDAEDLVFELFGPGESELVYDIGSDTLIEGESTEFEFVLERSRVKDVYKAMKLAEKG